MRPAALIALSLLAPLAGCAVTGALVTLPQNDECSMRAFEGLIDFGIAAVGAGIIYAEAPDATGAWVADGVFVASGLFGLARAATCNSPTDDNRPNVINPNLDLIPDSVKLEPSPTDPEVRDATPQEMGLVPANNAPTLTVSPTTEQPTPPTPPPAKEQPAKSPEEHAKPLTEPSNPTMKRNQ
ncbi:hypothetical protein BH11MYX2_BH11MYX2_00420 [soil metagenome]